MSSFFAVLFLLSLLGLIIGLVRPHVFMPVLKKLRKKPGRKSLGISFGFLCLLFLILTGLTAPKTKIPSSSTSVNHAIYQPLDAWYTDPGWVGYVNVGKDYKSIAASWTVPTVSQSATDTSQGQDELMSTWIGIGGFNGDHLVQVGTNQSFVSVEGGTPAYFAFWERYPTDPHTIQITELAISPGDKISASIAQQPNGEWLIQLSDSTSGQNFSKAVSFNADQTTAEWVLESEPTDSTISGPRTLPIFGSVTFSNLVVNGKTPVALRKVKMIRNKQVILEPSKLNADGSSFSLTDTR